MILQAKFWISSSFFILFLDVLDHTDEQSNILLSTSDDIISVKMSLSKLFLTRLIWTNFDKHEETK